MICGYLRMYVHHSSLKSPSTALGKNNDAHKTSIKIDTILMSYAITFYKQNRYAIISLV